MFRRVLSKRNRVLIKELVKTDFKLKYQGSVLGVAWSALKPLFLFVVMYFVFVEFMRISDPAIENYALVLLCGIAVWGFFSEATSMGMVSIVARGDILRKISFPKYIIVISGMINALISLMINLAIVLAAAVIMGVHFTWNIFWLPLNFIELFALVFGLSLILSTIYVKYHDIQHIWDVVMQALFYATPIIWPLSFVIANSSVAWAAKVVLLSPPAQIIQDIRHNLLAENIQTTWNYVGIWYLQIIPVVLTILILIVGILMFKKQSPRFAEVM